MQGADKANGVERVKHRVWPAGCRAVAVGKPGRAERRAWCRLLLALEQAGQEIEHESLHVRAFQRDSQVIIKIIG